MKNAKRIFTLLLSSLLLAGSAITASAFEKGADYLVMEEVAGDAYVGYAEGYPASVDWEWPECSTGEILKGTIISSFDPVTGYYCWYKDQTGAFTIAGNASAAFDGDLTTLFDPFEASQRSWAGVILDQPYELTEVRMLVRGKYLERMNGATIQGSNNGTDWYTLMTFDRDAIAEDYHIITPEPITEDGKYAEYYEMGCEDFSEYWVSTGSYQMYRFINLNGQHGEALELELYGKPAPATVPPEKVPNTLTQYNDKIVYTGAKATSVDGSFAAEIIGAGAEADALRAAFDGDTATVTELKSNADDTVDYWFGLKTAAPVVVGQIRVAIDPHHQIYKGYIQASNDGVNWVTLKNFEDWKEYATPAEGGYWAAEDTYKVVEITDKTEYQYFRYFKYNDSGNKLSEFQLVLDPEFSRNTMTQYNGEIVYTGISSVSVDGSVVGEVIGAGVDAATLAAAFDGVADNRVALPDNFNDIVDNWFGIKTEAPVVVNQIKIAVAPHHELYKCYFQGSTDGITWVTLRDFENWRDYALPSEGGYWPAEDTYRVVELENETAYQYYRYFKYNDGATPVAEVLIYAAEEDKANTINQYNGEIVYTGISSVSVDGSVVGEVIGAGVDAATLAAAFDGVADNRTSLPAQSGADMVDNWFGIKTEAPIVVNQIKIAVEPHYQLFKCYFQGSVDGINWVTLRDFENWKDYALPSEGGYWPAEDTYRTVEINADTAYQYFRYFKYNDGETPVAEVLIYGEAEAPETEAPETQAPETQAPETQAPETQAPETEAPEVPETYVLGDINGDGSVDITDAVLLFMNSMLPEEYEISYPGKTDFTKDGSVDIADAVRLFMYSMLPDEYPLEEEPETPETPYPVDKLTINGADISEYVISCNAAAGGVIPYAAAELQEYIKTATGVELPIMETPVEAGVKRISIDETIISDKDNFKYYTDEDGIVLAGSATRSALYAVYNFLENCIGWRFFTADTEICKEVNRIDLSDVDFALDMAFDIRDVYWREYGNADISLKRYQNGEGVGGRYMGPELGGQDWLAFNGIHNIGSLTGTGGGSSPNPCLNDGMIRKQAKRNLLNYVTEHPDEPRVHVSQNDTMQYCNCGKCTADIELYGSPAGSIIEFVNMLDDYLAEKGYPDVKIVTFAYQYSFPCPENIVCNDDIIIELCTIDNCFNHAFDDPDCPVNSKLMPEIEKWHKICKQFYIWDYTINFKYLLAAFPNFDVIRQNIKVMSGFNTMGLLEQGNYQVVGGEFDALRCYLMAKAMEDPNMTEAEYDAHMDEFLEAYYGPGWTYVRQYIDLITEISNEKNFCFTIYSSPEEIYGDHAFAPYSDQLVEWFDKAEEMAETELQRDHVKRSRICVDYLRIGAIFSDVMRSRDPERIKKMQDEYTTMFNSIFEYSTNRTMRIAENCDMVSELDLSVNPRAWWSLHEYRD